VTNELRFERWGAGVAGVFGGAKGAFQAIHALCEAGFTRTWIGFFVPARNDEAATVLDAEWEGDPIEALGVFPMRDGRQRSLQEVLQHHGISAATASHLDRTAPEIVVIVDAPHLGNEAASLLTAYGGRLAEPQSSSE
jgi:hypothetical protein